MADLSRQLFAGHRVRALRARLGLSQGRMAAELGISLSYLSQIESGDRPLTPRVLTKLAGAYPSDWGSVATENEVSLLVRLYEACADTSAPAALPNPQDVDRIARQHPVAARRMLALYDSLRRSQVQLHALDDQVETGGREPLPWEEVRDWFHLQQNYIDAIDRAAERHALGLERSDRAAGLIDRLQQRFGVTVESAHDPDGVLRAFDEGSRMLRIDPTRPPETSLFSLAYQLVRLEFGDLIADVADQGIGSAAGRDLLTAGLTNYAAGALLMPYQAFREAARSLRHDVDRLRQRFGTSFEQTCHRLSTLQRPGAAGIPMFFCRVDMAGNITKRHSATRLQFARYGGACPLWIVHEAVAIPDRILVQLAETPDGTRYVSMAKGLVKPSGSFARQPRRYAVALGCEERYAGEFIYADMVPAGGGATPIGTSCRICPRQDCDQRAFPPTAGDILIDPDRRTVIPYAIR